MKYHGYVIVNEGGINPVKVYEKGIKIYVCKTDEEAMRFIDITKRELAQAKK